MAIAQSARYLLFQYYLKRATTLAGWKTVLSRPDKLFRAMRGLSSDVKFNKTPVKEKLSIALHSVDALARLSQRNHLVQPRTLEAYLAGRLQRSETEDLATLFRSHGSDKASTHDYYRLYGDVLGGRRDASLNILEIGLGTNNIDVPSNMGLAGHPGASQRAFRDFLPNARIFGADVDKRVLFQEERIETFFVDQTDPQTLRALADKLAPRKFDLIIDDGLHNTEANLNSINFALPILADGGVLFIEDVNPSTLPFWQVALTLLHQERPGFFGEVLETRSSYAVLIRKR